MDEVIIKKFSIILMLLLSLVPFQQLVAAACAPNGRHSLAEPKSDELNAQDSHGKNILMLALYHKDADTANKILGDNRTTADMIKAKNSVGNNAIMITLENNLPNIANQLLGNPRVTADMIINTQNKYGNTVLMLAKAKGYTDIVNLSHTRLAQLAQA
jgi:hypothetical protein